VTPAAEKTRCRHCQRRPVNRPRGLCWGCYYTPGVREAYGWRDVGGSSRRGHGNGNGDRPTPPHPSPVLPGPDKVAVLAARAQAGFGLWHPHDGPEAD